MAGSAWWTPLRVCFVLCLVVFSAGVVLRAPCAAVGFDVEDSFVRQCYSDVGVLFTSRGLDTDTFPYAPRPDGSSEVVEYPVLQGVLMWVPALLVPDDLAPGDAVKRYYALTAAVLFLLALVTVWATLRTARERPWDAAIVAAAPSVALVGTLNWDFLPLALLALAILAWSRERPWLAGVLLGLGGAAKLYPLLILLPLLLLCLRVGRPRAFVRVAAATVMTWFVVNLPFYIANPEGWGRFYELSRERPFDFGSIWLGLRYLGIDVGQTQANTITTVAFVLACVAITFLAWASPRRPRLAQLALLTVAAFLLTSKVYSPQYALWLLPLVALARPRWRDVLIWQGGQALYYVAVWLWLNGFETPDRGLGDGAYASFILVQVASTLWICGMVVRDILQPGCDPVRTRPDGTSTGVDDPTGGVVEGLPDVEPFPFGHARRRVSLSEDAAVPDHTPDAVATDTDDISRKGD